MRGRFRSSVTELNTTENYTQEMQSIKEQAIADGSFMKAPNGKSTNLTEKQWLLVRTKNFINWFGDWINNPSEASKVVDENGEPLVVYHGSPNNWNVYNPKLFASNTDEGDYGQGLYLSSIKSKAEQYGNIKELFVNSKIPFRVGLDSKIGSIQEATRRGQIVDLFGRENAPEELKQYDSVLYTGGEGKYEEIVITNPNQIKSATSNTGEFSTINDDIRYSSVTERPIKVPSVTSFAERLQVQQQPKFAYLVARGEISTYCR